MLAPLILGAAIVAATALGLTLPVMAQRQALKRHHTEHGEQS